MNSAQRLFKKMFLYGFPASQAMKGATLSAFFRRLIHLEVMHLQTVPFFPLCFQTQVFSKAEQSGLSEIDRVPSPHIVATYVLIHTHT